MEHLTTSTKLARFRVAKLSSDVKLVAIHVKIKKMMTSLQLLEFWSWTKIKRTPQTRSQVLLTLYILGYFYTLFVPGGANLPPPHQKKRLVSDRIEIFWLLKLFFVKFLKINFLRL